MKVYIFQNLCGTKKIKGKEERDGKAASVAILWLVKKKDTKSNKE